MPGMSGPEVFERLHAIRPGLPVVLMSGYHEEELRPELDARINGFIQKPFTPSDLARRMRVALGAMDRAGDRRRPPVADEEAPKREPATEPESAAAAD
jgi:CheY-like chemotaxis protein